MAQDHERVLGLLAKANKDRSAKGLAEEVRRLIKSGELPVGTRFPTIRQIALTARLSVGTVAEAWRLLRSAGVLSTHQRGGTIVASDVMNDPPSSSSDWWRSIDLLDGTADARLLPDLVGPLTSALRTANLHSLAREDVTDRLRQALRATWPFEAQAWTTAGGGTESMLLAVEAVAPPGSTVAVDQPVVPGLLDSLRELGVTPIGLESDREGILPNSLHQVLKQGPAAVIYQPNAPFSLGQKMSAMRFAELADLLRKAENPPWLIEDDSLGPLGVSTLTLGDEFPDLLIRLRAYCRAYGIDLRTSVLGGSQEFIRKVREKRSHGVAVNSRILQNALAELILQPDAHAVVEHARSCYRARRLAFVAALEECGLHSFSSDEGLVVWVKVRHASLTIESLARRGIIVGNGTRALIRASEDEYLRIGITHLPNDAGQVRELAALIAESSAGSGREYFD